MLRERTYQSRPASAIGYRVNITVSSLPLIPYGQLAAVLCVVSCHYEGESINLLILSPTKFGALETQNRPNTQQTYQLPASTQTTNTERTAQRAGAGSISMNNSIEHQVSSA
eukprot:scaffold1110_cov78-Cyclotella_meneghiniana.AAC.4